MAREITDIEYLFLISIKEFSFLLDEFDYRITGMAIEERGETEIRFESNEFKRSVSIDLDNRNFNLMISNLRFFILKNFQVMNKDIIVGNTKEQFLEQLKIAENEKSIEKVIKIYSAYVRANLSDVLNGKKWFD